MIDENILIDRLHDNKETKMNISVPIGYYDVARRAWDACIKKVCKLIEEQQRIDTWVPCSERLPEVEQTVLLSLRSLDVSVGFRANTDGYFYTEGEGYVLYENVLAWQPLPEAYHE